MTKFFIMCWTTIIAVTFGCGNVNWKPEQLQSPQDNAEITTTEVNSDVDGGFGQIQNLADAVDRLDLSSAQNRGFRGQGIKIAILDNGFAELESALGRSIPLATQYDKNSQNPPASTRHGTTMAEVVYKVATGSESMLSPGLGPELLLYNSNGYSNFEESVHKAIAANVDIILYAQVWEYGGNFDGEGFINAVVNQATNHGIHWINAAGNFRKQVWSGPVRTDAQQHVFFDNNNISLPLQVSQERAAVKISMAWNDFKNQDDYATVQDLDLTIEDSNGKLIQAGTKRQSGIDKKDTTDWSAHAREIVNVELDPGNYLIKATNISQNFNENSVFQIMVQSKFIFLLAQPAANSILIPADNPNVITVGAQDYEFSSQSSEKPDVRLTSTVDFSSGRFIQGTSTAAAFAAAKLGVRISEFGPMLRGQAVSALLP